MIKTKEDAMAEELEEHKSSLINICLVMEANESICKYIELPAVPRKGEVVHDYHDLKVLRVQYSTSVDWVTVFIDYNEFLYDSLINKYNWGYYT